MAASRVAHDPKALSRRACIDLKPPELLKLLVHQVTSDADEKKWTAQLDSEQVLFDIDIEGEHYLLVRLPKAPRVVTSLSPREREIVRMVAKGHPNKVIAAVLNISLWTVCTHLRRIFAKLGVGSRAAMVARLLEESRMNPAPVRQQTVRTRDL